VKVAGERVGVDPAFDFLRKRRFELDDRDSCSVRPAAIAWPPNLSSRPGSRVAIASSTSRTCTPGTERAEPLNQPGSPGANATTGRCKAFLDARRNEADDALVPARVDHAHARRELPFEP
jgi:hypothetical protein